MKSQTISSDYLKLQQELHQNPNYGVASLSFAPIVADLIRQTNVQSVSDYGAGKKRLLEGLKKAGLTPGEYFPYDPVFPEYGEAKAAQLVCCIDVLEHIEPDLLDNILADLKRITTTLGFFTVHTGPAKKVLADGRNAHLIQESNSWWLKKLIPNFEIVHLQAHPQGSPGFWVIVLPRNG